MSKQNRLLDVINQCILYRYYITQNIKNNYMVCVAQMIHEEENRITQTK